MGGLSSAQEQAQTLITLLLVQHYAADFCAKTSTVNIAVPSVALAFCGRSTTLTYPYSVGVACCSTTMTAEPRQVSKRIKS
jgi:hypothetical protein